ncbi:hypothetical protein PYCC9005_001367 [Savitreella phatthalungensis]
MMQVETPYPPLRPLQTTLPPPPLSGAQIQSNGGQMNGRPLLPPPTGLVSAAQQTTSLPPISVATAPMTVMAASAGSPEDRSRETRKRTKTGCKTCRKRRIKCDEEKPACRRCIKSKRQCEGYSTKAVFRNESQYNYATHSRDTSTASSFAYPSAPPTHGYPHSHPPPPYSRNSSTSSGHSIGPHPLAALDAANRRISVQSLVGGAGGGAPREMPPTSHIRAPSVGPSSGGPMRHGRRESMQSPRMNQQPYASLPHLPSHQQHPPQHMQNQPQPQSQAAQHSPNSQYYFASATSPDLSAATVSRTGAAWLANVAPGARDDYLYDYFCREYGVQVTGMVPRGASDTPHLLTHTVPQLISEDPPGRRGLFDALVVYTAHAKGLELPCTWDIRSEGYWARTLELGLKSWVDIARGGWQTIERLDETIFSPGEDEVRVFLRWGILLHLVIAYLADNNPRTPWVTYLAAKAFSRQAFQARSELETFLVEALQQMASGNATPSPALLALSGGATGTTTPPRANGSPTLLNTTRAASINPSSQWLQTPGIDLVYFAFVRDHVALRNICYRVLSAPTLGFVSLAHRLVAGAVKRGEHGLDPLAQDLQSALDHL